MAHSTPSRSSANLTKSEPLLITLIEVARLLSVHPRTVRRLERDGKIPRRVGLRCRKLVLFRYRDITDWIKRDCEM